MPGRLAEGGAVAPSAMLRKLAAYERQNQLDLALREVGRIGAHYSCSTGWKAPSSVGAVKPD